MAQPIAGRAGRMAACIVVMLAAHLAHAATPAPAALAAAVSDYTGKLSADAMSYLSSSIEDGEKEGGPHIRVVVVDVDIGQALDNYAQALLAAQPPESRVDAVMVLQPAAGTARIAVVDAARPQLSSVAARTILRESVSPYLREDNLFAAIEQGTKRIEASLRAPPSAAAASSAPVRQDKSVSSAGIPPYAPVTDLSGSLAAKDIEGLRSEIAALQSRTGAQVAVLMLASAKPDTLEGLALRVFDAWKLGRKGVDDGVLIVVAKDDRRMRIEVGYGLEGILTDIASGRIINQQVGPLFRNGDFGGGLTAALEQVGRVIESGPSSAAPPSRDFRSSIPSPWALIVAGLIVLAATLSRFWLSALKASLIALVGCAAVMWLDQTSLGTTTFLGCFAAVLTYMLPAALLGEVRSSSGGSSGSGGGSGASGGGGSSGGAGASGSW